MERKTMVGFAIVVLGVIAIAAVAVLSPTAACRSVSGDIGGLSPLDYRGFSDGALLYSRDGGASVCSISVTILGVPLGLVLAAVGLFVLGS